ncbi:unnamed protein product, partial [Ectocarpus sp. 8 AP-2014]
RSKEEDRGEFLRRARAQREGRARERLHVSSATTIQKVWRGRSCVGKWRQDERDAWDRKMHDVGRVKAMLAAAGTALQLPPAVLQTLLSQLVHFHAFPCDAGRFRAAMDLVLAAAPASDSAANSGGAGLFAAQPASSSGSDSDRLLGDNTWSLLVARLGAVCLQYISQVSATVAAAAAGGGRSRKNGAESRDIGGGGGGGCKDAMDDAEGAEGAVVAGAAAAEVGDAAEVAMRGFALLASSAAWRHRWPLSELAVVQRRCGVFLASLALGRVLLGTRSKTGADAGPGEELKKPSPTGRGREGVRLLLRTERERVGGEGSRAPTLFGVLRVAWDAAAAEAGGGEGRATQAVRLLCASSFQVLGIGIAEDGEGTARIETRPMSSSAVAGGEGGGAAAGPGGAHETAVPDRRRLLEAFAAAVLPAPRLLEHPLSASLMDPMLGGDGAAWWELVSVAGE